LGIILHSGTVDRLSAAANLVVGTAARGKVAHLFVTGWALPAFAKDAPDVPLGGAGELASEAVQAAFEEIADWRQMLREAKELGDVRIHACSHVLAALGMSQSDLDPMVDDVLGVAGMLPQVDDARLLFI
jgi:peroxiredoxin family protein